MENTTGVTISRKSYTLDKLFKNESFRKFAPYFLGQPKTIIKVEEESGISRRTISEMLESFQKDGEYNSRYIGWYGGSRGLKIKTEILSDFIATKFNLDKWEVDALDELFSQEAIKKAIISENQWLDMAVMKALAITMIVAVKNQIQIDDPKYEERQVYFKKALDKAYENAPRGLLTDIKKLVPKGSIPLKLGLENFKDKNVEPWLKEYTIKNKNALASILVKMRRSNFHLVISPSDMYDMLLIRFGGILYIKRQFEVGNPEWVQQHMGFRASLKPKRKKKQEVNPK